VLDHRISSWYGGVRWWVSLDFVLAGVVGGRASLEGEERERERECVFFLSRSLSNLSLG
jgi:hypothetical protein